MFSEKMLYQYFITIVPTKLHTSDVSVDMHQFSVTERVGYMCALYMHVYPCESVCCCWSCCPVIQERVVNHKKGSHGVSGIFVKYKLSPLMVRVSEVHMPLSVFLVRLCGIVGGIFSTSGNFHTLYNLNISLNQLQ